MRQVYAYIRVSTVKQGEKGSSLTEQRVAIEAYASRQNLNIVEWFEERETAAKRGRTIFTQMLGLLLKGRATGVIIHKIDRSARNLRDWADLGNLVDKGIEIHFAHESVDLKSRGGRLAADIQAVVAADFIRNLRDEVRKGFQGRLRQGLYPLPAPVGYNDEGRAKAKTPDPTMAPLVRQAFRLYSTGKYNLYTLSQELHRAGLRNRRGGRVSKNGFSTLLNNEFYMGVIYIRRTGERYQGVHEPLISKNLFDRVQAVLHGRAKNVGLRNDFRYRKTLKCSTCSYSLVGEVQKGHVYYRCHTRECKSVCVRQDIVDEQIQLALRHLRMTPEELGMIEAEFKLLDQDRSLHAEDIRKSVLLNLENLKAREVRLTDAFIDQGIDKAAYDARKGALLHERSRLHEELNAAGGENDPSILRTKKFLELLKRLSSAVENEYHEEKVDLVKSATSNLLVAGKNLVFNWESPFDMLVSRGKSSYGAPYRDGSRTSKIKHHKEIKKRTARKLFKMLNTKKDRPDDRPSATA